VETGITAPFGDGEYHFQLLLPQAFELERSCDTTLLDLHERFEHVLGINQDTGEYAHISGGPGTKAILEVIRLALIGGAGGVVSGEAVQVGPVRAKQLVETYCWPAPGCPLEAATSLAGSIAIAAVRGIRLKKKASPDEATEPPSTAAASSPTAPSLD
jgi:hypothetical protein